jgi:hypothetical protein
MSVIPKDRTLLSPIAPQQKWFFREGEEESKNSDLWSSPRKLSVFGKEYKEI